MTYVKGSYYNSRKCMARRCDEVVGDCWKSVQCTSFRMGTVYNRLIQFRQFLRSATLKLPLYQVVVLASFSQLMLDSTSPLRVPLLTCRLWMHMQNLDAYVTGEMNASRRWLLITSTVDQVWEEVSSNMIARSFPKCGISVAIDASQDSQPGILSLDWQCRRTSLTQVTLTRWYTWSRSI